MLGRSRRETGQVAEQQARDYLQQQGLAYLTSNYRCKLGEIDLVMRSPQGEVIFVEVRYRRSQSHGGALASVDWHKQQKLLRTASHYLQSRQLTNAACRIDVLAIDRDIHNNPRIEWIRNAIEMG